MVVLALIIVGVIFTSDIIVPVAFAVLFALILLPIERKLEKKTGRVISISICLLSVLVFISLIMWFVVSQITGLLQSLPTLEGDLVARFYKFQYGIQDMFGIPLPKQSEYLSEAFKSVSSMATQLLFSTTYLMLFFIQVPIYVFLLLLYREKFKTFFLTFTVGDVLLWQKDVEGVIQNYIRGLAIVILIAGTLNSLGLMALGIDHALFFGFLSGALTMIPYIGISIGASLPFVFALLTKDSGWYAFGVVAVHLTVQFLEGNFITPRITGERLSINALAAILALLIGGKILGIGGMILAIPAVGTLRILLSYSKTFKPFVILLEGGHKSSTTHETIPDFPGAIPPDLLKKD